MNHISLLFELGPDTFWQAVAKEGEFDPLFENRI
jgi:hypothetical protein